MEVEMPIRQDSAYNARNERNVPRKGRTGMATGATTRQIRTNSGDTISVAVDTDAATIAILKAAPVTRLSVFFYLGNRPNRTPKRGNYDDMEAFFRAAGLEIIDDDLEVLLYNLAHTSGIAELTHRGKTIRYHVQERPGTPHRNKRDYTRRADYRLIEVR
jgi:hypothetical protein